MCAYVHIYMYTYIYAYVMYTFICIYTYMHTYTHVNIYVHVYIHEHIYLCVYIHTYEYAYICIYVQTCSHVHMQTYINIRFTHFKMSESGAKGRSRRSVTRYGINCNTLQHTATQWRQWSDFSRLDASQHIPTHCNTLQHAAIRCSTPRNDTALGAAQAGACIHRMSKTRWMPYLYRSNCTT